MLIRVHQSVLLLQGLTGCMGWDSVVNPLTIPDRVIWLNNYITLALDTQLYITSALDRVVYN